MNPASIDLKTWLDAFRESSLEVASGTLRFDAAAGAAGAGRERDDDAPRLGAYIALLGDQVSMHLGLTASNDGCRSVARALLGLRADAPISDADVMDGVNEVINIVAGKVKSRMVPHDATLRLGLPMFVAGEIRQTDRMERASAPVRLGPVECELLVFRNVRAETRRKAA